MKTATLSLLATALMASSAITSAALADQRRQSSSSQTQIQSCREADAGERCQRRNGNIVIKPDQVPSDFSRPEVDDEVWVEFEEGDMRRPVINGQMNNGQDASPAGVRQDIRHSTGSRDRLSGHDVDGLSGHDVDGIEARPANFGGEDIGFARGLGADAPEPLAMDCEDCDSDEDLPQEPIQRTPGGSGGTTTTAPSDDEDSGDCFRHPAGPDLEECDE